MTDVVAVRNTPGLKRGKTAKKAPWMDGHIAAGNIKVLPSEQDVWQDEPGDAPEPLHKGFSTGTYADASVLDHEDEDTDVPAEDEHSAEGH